MTRATSRAPAPSSPSLEAMVESDARSRSGSNRQIAEGLGVDHKTVGSVRADLAGRSEIPNVATITDTKGRKQPATKPSKPKTKLIDAGDGFVDEVPTDMRGATEMPETDEDPSMPKRPPLAALRAIQQIRSYRSWAPVEIYMAIRDALQEPHEYPQAARRPEDFDE